MRQASKDLKKNARFAERQIKKLKQESAKALAKL